MKLGNVLKKAKLYQMCINSHNYWTPRLSKDLSYNERHFLENFIKRDNDIQLKYAELQNIGILDNIIDLLF